MIVILSFVIAVCHNRESVLYKLLTQRWLVFIGILSYSLYLWHWSVLAISRLTVGITPLTIPFQLVAIVGLAVLSYRFIEQPFRFGRHEQSLLLESEQPRTGRVFRNTVVVVLGFSLLMVLVLAPLHERGYLYTGRSANLMASGSRSLGSEKTFGEFSWSAEKCALRSNAEVGKQITFDECTIGTSQNVSRKFLVIGNSYSAAQIEMYEILVQRNRGSVAVTSSWGASIVPELKNTSPWAKASDYYWNTTIPSLLSHLSAGDVLLMISDSAHLAPLSQDTASQKQLNMLKLGLSKFTQHMNERGIIVIYQSSVPFIRESGCTPAAAVTQWWNIGGSSPCTYYSRQASLQRRHTYHQLLEDIALENSNFVILDLFDLFCPSDLCKFYDDNGVFLYRDQFAHPSIEANILAQPWLLSVVDKAVSDAAVLSSD